MAIFIDPAIGASSDVHTVQQNAIGMVARATDGSEWVYLKGVASTVAGSWVTFDEAGVTALLATNAKGPVAVAGAANVANTFGWYCRRAPAGVSARIAANTADNSLLGRETADGDAGDGRAAGDEIYNAICRGAVGGAAALATVQIFDPFVDDANGA